MLRKIWEFQLENTNYILTLRHNFFTDKIKIFINGAKIASTKFSHTYNDCSFEANNHTFSLFITEEDLNYTYKLIINGAFTPSEKTNENVISAPRWSIYFAISCLLITILCPEGLLPQLFGIVGAIKCISISKNAKKTTKQRIKSCLTLTISLWIIILIFSFILAKVVAQFY